jgi:hypothetical protein
MLAHIQVMLTTLEGLASSGAQQIMLDVHVLVGFDAELDARLRAAGVTPHYHCPRPETPLVLPQQMARLAAMLHARSPDVVVWLCLQIGMADVFSQRVAPLQVWWSAKLHPPSPPGTDLRISTFPGEPGRVMVGTEAWTNIPFIMKVGASRERHEPAVQALRAQIGAPLLVGSLVREERLQDPAFHHLLCSLLRAVPEAVYVHTGRHEVQAMRQALAGAGVLSRARFVGWVDTALWASALDVLLDPFPTGAGMTAVQCLMAGTPAVYLAAPAGAPSSGLLDSYFGRLRQSPALSEAERDTMHDLLCAPPFGDLWPSTSTHEAYLARAISLCTDPVLREATGRAGRAYATRYMTDAVTPGLAFQEAILQGLARCRAAH